MTTETWFQPLTIETAPEGATKLVAATARRFGFVPSPIARSAGSPSVALLAGASPTGAGIGMPLSSGVKWYGRIARSLPA